MTDTVRQHAVSLLDELIRLDKQTTNAYYEMGRILHALWSNELYEVLGYESFPHMVEEELTFSYGTAQRYAHTYRRLRELKYSKQEAMDLIEEHSYTRVARVVSKLPNKVGKRAFANRAAEDTYFQLNFQLKPEEYDEMAVALEAAGARYNEDRGRWEHSSEALINIIRGHFGHQAAA